MIKFNCPHCDQHIAAEPSDAGAATQCPSCGGEVVVPAASNEVEEDSVEVPAAPTATGDADRNPEPTPRGEDEHSFAARLKEGAKEGWGGIKRHSKQVALKAQAEKLRNVDLRKALHELGKKCFELGIFEDVLPEQFQAIRDLDTSIAEKRVKAGVEAEETKMATLKRKGMDAAHASHAQALTVKREHLVTELGRQANAAKTEALPDALKDDFTAITGIEERIHQKEAEIRQISTLRSGNTFTSGSLIQAERGLHEGGGNPRRSQHSIVPLFVCCIIFGWILSLPFSGRYLDYGMTFSNILAIAMLAVPSLTIAILAVASILSPRRIEWHKTLGVMCFTMVFGIILLFRFHDVASASQDLNFTNYGKANAFVYSTKAIAWLTLHTDSPNILLRLLAQTVAVGLCEEIVKLLPLFLLVIINKNRGGIPELKSFLWLGFFSGLGFGIGEAIYTYSPWGTYPTLSLGGNVIRWFACVPLHAVYTIIDASFLWLLIPAIKRAKGVGESAGILVVASLAIALLHGIYNTFQGFHWMIGIGLDAIAIVLMAMIVRYCLELEADASDMNREPIKSLSAPRWLTRRRDSNLSFGRLYAVAAAMVLSSLVFSSGSPGNLPVVGVFGDLGVELDQGSAIVYAMGYTLGSNANPGTSFGDLESIAHQSFAKNQDADPALLDVMVTGLKDGFSNLPNRLEGIDFDSLPAAKTYEKKDLSSYCRTGDLKKVKEIATSENADIEGIEGYPLQVACENGHGSIARLLLSLGAKPDRPGPYGLHPIHDAVEKGDLELVKLLVSSGVDVDQPTSPPVADRIRIETSSMLGVPSNDEAQPIHYAARGLSISLVDFLLSRGASIEARDAYGNTPLHSAAGWRIGINLRLLLGEEGVKEGKLSLQKRNKLCKYLLERGASTSARNEAGMTPLDVSVDVWEVGKEHDELVRMLGGDSALLKGIRAAVGQRDGNLRLGGAYVETGSQRPLCLKFYEDRTMKITRLNGTPSISAINSSLKNEAKKWESGFYVLSGPGHDKPYSRLKIDVNTSYLSGSDKFSGSADGETLSFSCSEPSWLPASVRGYSGSFKFYPE
jgi:RsiW-degrading membrane proteinase PrsW (M82 family)